MRTWWILLIIVAGVSCAREDGPSDATVAASDTVVASQDTTTARFNPKVARATEPPHTLNLLQEDVQVMLRDGHIEMPATLSPAQATFNITNTGTHEHSFEVEGGGIEKALDRPLQPGQSAKLVVDLHAGTYKVYCPVADHEDRGMTRPLVVR